MPPSKHSGSSMSAHKDSDQIPSDQNYTLGDYSFRIERSSVPGSSNDKIEAICTDKDGKNARKSIQIPSSTEILGWYVEANDTTADVYVMLKIAAFRLTTGELNHVSLSGFVETGSNGSGRYYYIDAIVQGEYTIVGSKVIVGSETNPDGNNLAWYGWSSAGGGQSSGSSKRSFTYDGKTVYYASWSKTWYGENQMNENVVPSSSVTPTTESYVAWDMVYGEGSDSEKEMLVARFAIDLEDAGGVGPGSDWIDPGDYDEDWEEGDPTHTLYVTVTGALSGRHNDPIVDPSYSYIPADKDTVKDYGCGGDGGHGGGGGAGAATVVIHKFATNQANSKEVTAIARRHGYGSGGGKGGKGGDGCILVYY